jgi:nitroreductase
MRKPQVMSETLLDIIQQRRSIRQYDDRPVSDDVLLRLLEAARWTPSAHNRQLWRVAILRSAQSRHALASASGWGTCWMCVPLFCPDVVRDTLDLGPDWEP